MAFAGEQGSDFAFPPEFEQFSAFAQALVKAQRVEGELFGRVPGALDDYMRHVQEQAVNAISLLVNADPTDAVEILRLQKLIAPYIDVTGWVLEKYGEGDQAIMDAEIVRSRPTEE